MKILIKKMLKSFFLLKSLLFKKYQIGMLKDLYEEALKLLQSIEEDVNKFCFKNNKTAGIRIRKVAQEEKQLLQKMRTEIQNVKAQNAEAKGEKKTPKKPADKKKK